jgi:hypothetical protein
MHPTGMSLPLIENLNDYAVASRRVIGGVMPLRITKGIYNRSHKQYCGQF